MNRDRGIRRGSSTRAMKSASATNTAVLRSVPPTIRTATKTYTHTQVQNVRSKPEPAGARKKPPVPTATKTGSLASRAEEAHSSGRELDGQFDQRPTVMHVSNRPQRAARKADPARYPHVKPVGGRFYIKNGQLKRIESDEDSDTSMEE